jgi:hypothetical protein
MTCKAVTEKKYRNRPSPPYHAGDCPDQTLKGNDGRNYVSRRVTKKNKAFYVWLPTNKAKQYEIHYNGSRPYVVEVSKTKATIFTNTVDDNTGKTTSLTKMKDIPFKKIWLGERAKDQDYEKGSTILVQRSGDYVLIGGRIFSFTLSEPVVHFYNPIGNNDVPYPYIVGKDNIYFLISTKGIQYAPKTDFDLNGDVYEQLYALDTPLPTIPSKAI